MEKHILLDKKFIVDDFIGNKIDDFEILQTLGKGSYGYVSKVKSKINNKIYALKMIDFSLIKDEQEKDLSKMEINILRNLDSPHIIKYYNYFVEGEKYYIIMEFINNGDIKGYIAAYQNMKKSIPENELWELFFQCISGLVYIHNNKIIHRDIKPANLFMTDNKTIKIGDFGVSAQRKIKTQKTPNINNARGFSKETLLIGTPLYMSPEMYNHQEYGSKVDVYAMGCTFYEMCFFSPPRIPIPIMDPKGEIVTDLQDVTPKENLNVYSVDLIKFINMMIEKDVKKRPSSDEILQFIRKRYIIHNSSIGCVFRCLLAYKNLIDYLRKSDDSQKQYQINEEKLKQIRSQKPISYLVLYALVNDKNINYNIILSELREVLSFNNPYFDHRDEIEPKDLIDFLIKKIHIENNEVNDRRFSRIYTKINDLDTLDEGKMFKKYNYTFNIYFNSFISKNFYGIKEAIKNCSICSSKRYCPESFYYLKFDANEVNKYFSNSNNFILDVLKKESENYVKNELSYCPFCKKYTSHKISKKIVEISFYLIISLESEDNSDNSNLKYPLSFNLGNIGKGTYNLKGVIKKTISDGKKYFISIYKEMDHWLLSDGINQTEELKSSSPLNLNNGNIIMLFYSIEN